MKSYNLKGKFKIITVMFFVGIILVWMGFYIRTAIFLKTESKQVIGQMSGQIIKDLQSEFLKLESIAFSISQDSVIKEFIKEEDTLLFHDKSAKAMRQIKSLLSTTPFMENLIIYGNNEDTYYRFMGTLDNTALARVYYIIDRSKSSSHIIQMLDGVVYIGYVCEITDNSNHIGSVVLLTKEENLSNMFLSYGTSEIVKIALSANGVIISASDKSILGNKIEIIEKNAGYFVSSKIGITPFEVLVFAEKDYFNTMGNSVAIAIIITATLFVALFLSFIFILNRNFVRPMFMVMEGVANVNVYDGTGVLAKTNEESFDKLVKQINIMLARIDEKSKALFETHYMLQNAEISRQKALVISLKKQINTHFTVNVLNIIKLLAKNKEMDKVGQMCDGLSYLLRYSGAGEEFINGLDEMFILQKYISIMNIRYKNSFLVDFDFDDRIDTVVIPRMLIQPIIENAIVHGFKGIISGGILNVTMFYVENAIEVCVSDNGKGMSYLEIDSLNEKILEARRDGIYTDGTEHIGLPNIERRIFLYYGDGYGIKIESEMEHGTTVTMRLGVKV